MTNLKRSFKTTINGKSVWDYVLESKHSIISPPIVEIENARLFCGLSIEQFESLSGTKYWSNEENSIGIYESKSDVLIFYRVQKLTEAIINDLNVKEIKKG